MRITTESGSIYTIDLANKRWRSTSISTRTASGVYDHISPLKIGMPLVMTMPSLTPGGLFRLIHTSPITVIDDNMENAYEQTAT